MKQLTALLIALSVACGCSTTPAPKQSQLPQDGKAAVDLLNEQIKEFNDNRMPNMGVNPIDKRVSRIEHNPTLKHATAFYQDGKQFLILKLEPDGRFKGVLEQEYNQLVGSGADGSHSWGHVLAEFYLEKGMF